MDSFLGLIIVAFAFSMTAIGNFARADQIVTYRCNNEVSEEFFLVAHEEGVLRDIIHLTADEQINGIYTTQVTEDPAVYGRSTCSTSDRKECQGCISQAVGDVNSLCGYAVGGYVARDLCTVRYEKYPILGD